MSNVKTIIIPSGSRTRRILCLAAIVLAVLLASPIAASAAGPTTNNSLIVKANIFVGPSPDLTLTALNPAGSRVRTTGEELNGCVTASNWTAIPLSCGTGVFPLQVDHTSTTTILQTGRIHGKASGDITLDPVESGAYPFYGQYQGDISAVYDTTRGLAEENRLYAITSVEDKGTWSASNGTVTAKGTYRLKLAWDAGLGTLVGTIELAGTHN